MKTKTNNPYGFSLIELMTVLAIFAVVMAGLYAAYSVQLKQGVQQFRLAESEMELTIARNIIERDISMAGYGIMDDYKGVAGFTLPRALDMANSDPDSLTMTGTALGMSSRTAQGWTIAKTITPVIEFREWTDAREDLRANDRVVLMDPNTRNIQLGGGSPPWIFQYTGSGTDTLPALPDPFIGMVLYGLNQPGVDATQPYYRIRYRLGGSSPSSCPGIPALLRAESKLADSSDAVDQPVLNCVLDFQVAFGLDTNDDMIVDTWDNGTMTATLTPVEVKKRIKQVRVYALVQIGARDPNYIAVNSVIRVGDLGLPGGATGRNITLSAAQLKYRWHVLSITVTPRNLRT